MNVQKQKNHRKYKRTETDSKEMSRRQNNRIPRYTRNSKKDKRNSLLKQHDQEHN